MAVIDGDIALDAGNVQNTVLLPEAKSCLLSLFDEEITVSLDKVSGEASVTVPIPTSQDQTIDSGVLAGPVTITGTQTITGTVVVV